MMHDDDEDDDDVVMIIMMMMTPADNKDVLQYYSSLLSRQDDGPASDKTENNKVFTPRTRDPYQRTCLFKVPDCPRRARTCEVFTLQYTGCPLSFCVQSTPGQDV